jgi:hypothetical protein
MSAATLGADARSSRPRPALRPLALPTEHGGWGFLFEPIVLGLLVAPSAAGALVALSFAFAFLARQPLKLAMQDALRGRNYPRTSWCRGFAAGYSLAAAGALAAGVAIAGWTILLPLAVVAPLGVIQLVFDARNRSRALLPELGGSVAMASSAAAIALAGGAALPLAAALTALVVARGIPTIVYVRTLLTRAHGQSASALPALVLHMVAMVIVASFAPLGAVIAMAGLLVRAAWQLTRAEIVPARRIGWTEIVFGLVTVLLCGWGY